MSNIIYLDDFKEPPLNSALYKEIRFFEHISANNNSVGINKANELHELVCDLMPVVDKYFDQLHSMNDIDDLINSLQRVFVFLNQETKHD
jgi:hypothetical protein